MPTLRNWQKRFFRREIFHPGKAQHVAAASKEVAFAWRAMRLNKGDRLLDLCCGAGRHSIPLAKRGLMVVGLDATPSYLKDAKRRGRGIDNLRFVQGDMRRLPFREEFDAVVNLWTSFGYFLDPKDDLKVLRCVARALKPGGRFLIDIINADFLRAHGRSRYWEREQDGTYRLEDCKMREGRDPGHTNAWTIIRPGKNPVSAVFFVRGYNYERLSRLLRSAGLESIRCWGDTRGGLFKGAESLRLVILAKKPIKNR